MAVTALPGHGKHRHWWYGLTCAEYEGLLSSTRYQCATCARPHAVKPLVIDHDGRIGDWAVRGLICQRCNAALRYDRPDPDWALGYLADPWWRRMLVEHGLEAALPEPATGRVLDFYGHRWSRWDGLWTTGHKRRISVPWTQLVRMFGPRNLTPVVPRELESRKGDRG